MPMFLFMDGGSDGEVSRKVKDPKMTTENNPLFTGRPTAEDMIARRNMKRLVKDAAMKECPYNGHVYEAMMSTRYASHREEN